MALSNDQQKNRERWLANLRTLIEYAEARPDMPAPACWDLEHFFPKTREELAEAARYHAPVKKVFTGEAADDWFYVVKQVGDITLKFSMRREDVCSRVPTGTKQVTRPKYEQVKAGEETVEVETFEWKCDPILADREAPAPIVADAPALVEAT